MENQTKDAVETVKNYQVHDDDAVIPGASPSSNDGYRLSTLTELADALGPGIASLVEVSGGDRQTVSSVVFYDRSAPLASAPGAIALAIGLPLTGESLSTRLEELKQAGYAALVYKTHGAPDAQLRQAARSAGIALFRAVDVVPWGQLAQIIGAATVPRGNSRLPLADIRPGDLFELADAVASLAGGAVAVVDPDQNVLAYSTLPGQPIDDTRRRSILQLHVPHTEQNDQDYRRVHASHEVVTVAPQEHSLTRSVVAIRAGLVVLGSLWIIEPDGGITPDVARVLDEAAKVAALHLLHRRTTQDSSRARQIELVTPLLFQSGGAELVAVQLGIAAEHARVVAVAVCATEGTAADTLQSSLLLFDTVRIACTVWLPDAVCGLADNVVYIVLPQSSSSSQAFQREAVLRIVHHTRRLMSRAVLAGLGSVKPIAALASSRVDAESVLAVLLKDADDQRLRLDSDDIVADLHSLGPRLQLRQIVTELRASGHLPGEFALQINDYDSRRNTAFGQTLRTYLDCKGNAIETATALGLHANTVRYRLSRVEELFGIRLEDPETRLLLWLQLRASLY
ncbi:helix-turn-helix domain-containing protein [Parafrigoribacterium mesophilum]|uniref:PucR family transcriptional regulator n=1 Tax=Parafrigoribacterium mesophilum TaxID=433646 RepID=UPI0031FD77BC